MCTVDVSSAALYMVNWYIGVNSVMVWTWSLNGHTTDDVGSHQLPQLRTLARLPLLHRAVQAAVSSWNAFETDVDFISKEPRTRDLVLGHAGRVWAQRRSEF